MFLFLKVMLEKVTIKTERKESPLLKLQFYQKNVLRKRRKNFIF